MNNDFKKAFDVLDINEKRNQISNELIIINEIIKKECELFNIPASSIVKNYTPSYHKKLKESEILTFFYEDIYNIEQELLTLFEVINNK